MDTIRCHGLLLVVDDEEGMRESLADILEELGITADLARNGREAVAMVNDHEYLLVVMDIRMPEMSGTEALAAIAARRPGLPVIMMTAYADQQAEDAVARSQAYALMRKPIDLGVFLPMVQGIVRERMDAAVPKGS